MGFPPPPDLPAPGPAIGPTAEGGFTEDPSSSSLCGFQFPPFIFFKFGFNLPSPFSFPPSLPIPHISLSINCDINNPFSLSTGVTWGGNRAPNGYPDPDALEQAA